MEFSENKNHSCSN